MRALTGQWPAYGSLHRMVKDGVLPPFTRPMPSTIYFPTAQTVVCLVALLGLPRDMVVQALADAIAQGAQR
jgi:hypothetical protein